MPAIVPDPPLTLKACWRAPCGGVTIPYHSVARLTTGRQAVEVLGEVIEAFGGAGYVEDTGLPVLLRDAHVLPIWEGTTDVLALDTLRALAQPGAWEALCDLVERLTGGAADEELRLAGRQACAAPEHARRWHAGAAVGRPRPERGARRPGMTLGRALQLALLVDHAGWSLAVEGEGRARAAALRFAGTPVDLISDVDYDDRALADDTPLPVGSSATLRVAPLNIHGERGVPRAPGRRPRRRVGSWGKGGSPCPCQTSLLHLTGGQGG
jgi:hypothetical protein